MLDLNVNGYHFEVSECGPPSESGVYLIIICNPRNNKIKIMYVGSSVNIYNRLSNQQHPYHRLLNKFSNLWVATASCVTDNFKELELAAIKHFKPSLNIIHNGK